MPPRPLVWGHRGARFDAPENTLAAFDLAVRQGAGGVELDVRLDADRDVIVLHDRTLARVTGWHDVRDVELVGSRELARVDLGGGEHPPRLEQVLAWAVRGGHRVNVEVKHDVTFRAELVRRVARLVSALPAPGETVLLSSFHPAVVRELARRLPGVNVAWLVHAGQRVLRRAPGFRWLGARAVHPEAALATPAMIRRLKRAGAEVNVWTVNDPEQAKELAALGVDGIMSDRPGVIAEALRDKLGL
jgi:glycerophosphoryl diester phosphodiesterase